MFTFQKELPNNVWWKIKRKIFLIHANFLFTTKISIFCWEKWEKWMDDWEKLNETSLPEKGDFCSHLNMEDINDADYAHPKRACQDFEIKISGEYHDLYIQNGTLLLDDIFENFTKMNLEICELDLAKFLSAPELAWQAAFKNTKVKSDLLADINILLMVEKGIREEIYHSVYQYAKANSKYMKDYDKNKESPYIQYWDVNNIYGWVISQKLPVNKFEWIDDTSQFNEDFIKNCNKESDKVYDVQYLEQIHDLHSDLSFLPETIKSNEANLHEIMD